MKRILISICAFLLSIILASCDGSNIDDEVQNNDDKESSEAIRNYETYKAQFTNINETFKQKESEYYIYFFSYYCEECGGLKDTVFDYIDSKKLNLYFVSCDEFKIYDFVQDGIEFSKDEIREKNLNQTELSKVYISYIPCLIKIQDGKIVNTTIGYSECFSELGGK